MTHSIIDALLGLSVREYTQCVYLPQAGQGSNTVSAAVIAQYIQDGSLGSGLTTFRTVGVYQDTEAAAAAVSADRSFLLVNGATVGVGRQSWQRATRHTHRYFRRGAQVCDCRYPLAGRACATLYSIELEIPYATRSRSRRG